jgi:hypothetical protein
VQERTEKGAEEDRIAGPEPADAETTQVRRGGQRHDEQDQRRQWVRAGRQPQQQGGNHRDGQEQREQNLLRHRPFPDDERGLHRHHAGQQHADQQPRLVGGADHSGGGASCR